MTITRDRLPTGGGPVETTLWRNARGYTAVSADGAAPTELALDGNLRDFTRIALLGRGSRTDLIVLYLDAPDIPVCEPGDNVQTIGRAVSASGSAPGDARSVPVACSSDGRVLHLVRGPRAPLTHINRVVGRR